MTSEWLLNILYLPKTNFWLRSCWRRQSAFRRVPPRPPVVVTRQLVVLRHRLSTFGRRAFTVAGQMSCISLPNSLCESACDDNISDDCFKHSLKTFFSGYWRRPIPSAVEIFTTLHYINLHFLTHFTYILNNHSATMDGWLYIGSNLLIWLHLRP